MRLFLFLILCSFSSLADVIEAPAIPSDLQQNPDHIIWKHIVTEHFDIIFPKEVEDEGQRVAHLLEKVYPFVSRSLEVSPAKIPVVLHNQSMTSNGFVTLAPRRSEWYLTPTIDPELNTDWLKTLAIHEFRHVVQFEKSKRGFNNLFEVLLGEIGQAIGLGLTAPPWFYEGDAVGIETALTQAGRGRLPLFERDLRTLLLSGKKFKYDKTHLGSYADWIPSHYVYGYFYTSWLRNQYGDLFLSKLINHSAENSWNPLTFYNASSELTGEKFETTYKKVMKELVRDWSKKLKSLDVTPYKVRNLSSRAGWTNYYYPQTTAEGKILALKDGLSFVEQFVLIDGDKEEHLFYPGPLHSEYPYKLRDGKMAFFEVELDPRWGYRDYTRLKVYDLNNRKIILDKRHLKGRLAVINHTGKELVYVEWNEGQGQEIVVIDLFGKELKRISHPKNEVITSLDWVNSEEVIFVTKDQDDLKAIMKLNVSNKNLVTLLPKRMVNIGYITSENSQIFFESPESGIDNLYLLTFEGPSQITNSKFCSYAPSFFQDKLIYNDYTAKGMNIVTKELPWSTLQKSSDSFVPVYEKFAQKENYSLLQSQLLDRKTYKVGPYSQTKNAVNLHSWVILAPPLSPTLTLMGLSRDILNKLTLAAGAQYNINEGTSQGFTSATWSHLYPVIDLKAAYGTRRQDFELGPYNVNNKWEEGTAELGISLPWKYIEGRFLHNFSIRAFSKIIKVTNKLSGDATQMSDGALHSPGADIFYSYHSRLAARDMNPPWGYSFSGHVEEGKDITGDPQRGSLRSVDNRLYLPGLWHHHSFYHQFAYEKQRDDSYQYSSFMLYPRGTDNVFLREFTKYSANYLLPAFYPDFSFSRYLYLKRISLNLFYDELNGNYLSVPYHAASTGWEAILEVNLLRIFIPINLGIRGNYVLGGKGEANSYEIFLSSLAGTF